MSIERDRLEVAALKARGELFRFLVQTALIPEDSEHVMSDSLRLAVTKVAENKSIVTVHCDAEKLVYTAKVGSNPALDRVTQSGQYVCLSQLEIPQIGHETNVISTVLASAQSMTLPS